jgi:hypothetical protein
VVGSDAFSSYEGIPDWMTANVQQTDTVQQFLACEKCYKITGGCNNCVATHEPLSYTDKYPLTKNSRVALNGGRMAEIALAPEARRDEEQEFLHSGRRQLAGQAHGNCHFNSVKKSQDRPAGELTEGEPHGRRSQPYQLQLRPPSEVGGEVVANGRHGANRRHPHPRGGR